MECNSFNEEVERYSDNVDYVFCRRNFFIYWYYWLACEQW